MSNNFITNADATKTLRTRVRKLMEFTTELRFLVGFFYFSGWQEIYDKLKENEEASIKLLVGLEVQQGLGGMIEDGVVDASLSNDEIFSKFLLSLQKSMNNEEMDTEAFYNQVTFFLKMITERRLEIRKTLKPNHAKLYVFKFNDEDASKINKPGSFITGSSNLTRSGLQGQEEFNVEILEHGYQNAVDYFDELWKSSLPITEDPQRLIKVIELIEHKSQAATVTPYEAFALILKTYLDLQEQKQIKPIIEELLEKNGFSKFTYQIDAVRQAMTILEEYNGVIIADVVGLGKSVVAALIAKSLGKRGMVICPPGLIGDQKMQTGWWEYVERFNLEGWLVESRGRIELLEEELRENLLGIEVVIIDEAHYFRNQDTAAYEALANICRDKQVILLTATPFNNSPMDIFSLLKLFIIPGVSGITEDDNLEAKFKGHNYRFKRLSTILKYANTDNVIHFNRALRIYNEMFGPGDVIDIALVREATRAVAEDMKRVMSTVTIRRNRLDLKEDYIYKQEVTELSEVMPPVELFFEMDKLQNEFYDRIIKDYFSEDGVFKGAIYQPFFYEKEVDESKKLNEEQNRTKQQQTNLFGFMRRLLVRRFESSFGAFEKSIGRFVKVHKLVLQFIESSGGKYILDRKLIENIKDMDDENEIIQMLEDFEASLLIKARPKHHKVYNVETFDKKEDFLLHIENDIKLFENIQAEMKALDLVRRDPKREEVFKESVKVINAGKTKRKVIIFSEYVDTVLHLKDFFLEEYGSRVLICDGKITNETKKSLNTDFNAQYKGEPTDEYDILITSDKLAEGFNLNRAGLIINYDIPWNPTKVIQRVGRINRIGKKVFDELMIYNFFPTEKGATVVKSREIASQKMYIIHNALGEDAAIFDVDESPSASGLFKKINQDIESEDELSFHTVARNAYAKIKTDHPDVITRIEGLPERVKSGTNGDDYELNVLRKKGLGLFAQHISSMCTEDQPVMSLSIEELYQRAVCEYETETKPLSKFFWENYETIKSHKSKYKTGTNEKNLMVKARNNLKSATRYIDFKDESDLEFISVLMKDLKKYYTLPTYTLRRLAKFEMTKSPSAKVVKSFFEEIHFLKASIGMDYLDRIIERSKDKKLEVIIAVEKS
jgi:superfamily II DNA or RNA helicase/HKD family nuclease